MLVSLRSLYESSGGSSFVVAWGQRATQCLFGGELMFRKNVAGQFIHFQGVDATTGGIKSGVTWTVRRCIDGTFAAATGTVTEDGTTGWYKFAMSQADTNGNDIAFNFTGTGAIPVTVGIVTTAADPTSAASFGITNIDAAVTSRMASYTQPTGFLAATFPTTVASPTNITAASGIAVASLGAGVITAASIAAAALNGKGDWNVGKTGYSLTQSFPANFASLAITVGGAVTAGTVSDKSGYSLTTAPLDAAGTRSAVGLATANLDTQLGLLLPAASYTAPDNVGIAAIQAKTDSLAFTAAGKVDSNVLKINGVTVTGDGSATPWGP